MSSRLARRLLIPVTILAVAGAGFAVLVATKPRSQAALRTETVWSVAVRTAQPQALHPTLTLFGRIESPRRSRLRSAVEAEVQAVRVKEGEAVARDQSLVILDQREALALVAQRRAEVRDAEAALASEAVRHRNDLAALEQEQTLLALAQAEVKRAQDLLGQKLGSESQLDAARQNRVRQQLAVDNRGQSIADHENRQRQLQARLDRARAQLEIAELDWQRTRIAAPFRGRVARVAVAEGDRVRVGDTLLELYDVNALEVRAQVPSTQIAAVRQALDAGQRLPAEAVVDGRSVTLELDRLAGEVAKGSGGVEALFGLVTNGEGLPVGRFVTLMLQLPRREHVFALPREALYGRDRIYKVSEGRLVPVTVQRLGSLTREDGGEEILVAGTGLQAGDAVVVTQLPNAIEGLRVRTAAEY